MNTQLISQLEELWFTQELERHVKGLIVYFHIEDMFAIMQYENVQLEDGTITARRKEFKTDNIEEIKLLDKIYNS